MRRLLKISAAVLVLAGVTIGAFLFVPQVTEKSTDWTCWQQQPGEWCQRRMRAMGHVWSRKDNLARAQAWYARAAGYGDPASMFHLAWTYEQAGYHDLIAQGAPAESARAEAVDVVIEQPLTPRQSFQRAADWYRKSADKGFSPAMNNLGQLYLSGVLGQPDLREAFRWHLAAARAGNPVGAMNVALAYRVGQGVAANAAEAEKWSAWKAPDNANGDLVEPTLARTSFFGSGIPPQQRNLMRAAAQKGEPLTTRTEPLKPDARVPAFDQTRRKLQNQPQHNN